VYRPSALRVIEQSGCSFLGLLGAVNLFDHPKLEMLTSAPRVDELAVLRHFRCA